ncbi:hypothetical protein LDJ79_19880 [Vibrio tritonius]|uniref:Transmembrane protein n=1 Tax=Vibrio tritonius TaxID=1435069 RepID=A0ABS7YTK0_9VIBR|nr:hypothetical protein [Vibrio tritonius]MCA2018387.1 hypothetical protein [Vibrio tritonius]
MKKQVQKNKVQKKKVLIWLMVLMVLWVTVLGTATWLHKDAPQFGGYLALTLFPVLWSIGLFLFFLACDEKVRKNKVTIGLLVLWFIVLGTATWLHADDPQFGIYLVITLSPVLLPIASILFLIAVVLLIELYEAGFKKGKKPRFWVIVSFAIPLFWIQLSFVTRGADVPIWFKQNYAGLLTAGTALTFWPPIMLLHKYEAVMIKYCTPFGVLFLILNLLCFAEIWAPYPVSVYTYHTNGCYSGTYHAISAKGPGYDVDYTRCDIKYVDDAGDTRYIDDLSAFGPGEGKLYIRHGLLKHYSLD